MFKALSGGHENRSPTRTALFQLAREMTIKLLPVELTSVDDIDESKRYVSTKRMACQCLWYVYNGPTRDICWHQKLAAVLEQHNYNKANAVIWARKEILKYARRRLRIAADVNDTDVWQEMVRASKGEAGCDVTGQPSVVTMTIDGKCADISIENPLRIIQKKSYEFRSKDKTRPSGLKPARCGRLRLAVRAYGGPVAKLMMKELDSIKRSQIEEDIKEEREHSQKRTINAVPSRNKRKRNKKSRVTASNLNSSKRKQKTTTSSSS